MRARLLARLPILGALALMVAAPASGEVRPEPGIAFSQEFGPGWLSHVVAYPEGGFVVAGRIFAPGDGLEGVTGQHPVVLTGERRFASETGINPVAVRVAADGSVVLAGVLGRRCGFISGSTAGGTAWIAALAPDGLPKPAR